MASQEHLDVLKKGVNIWNAWRKQHPKIDPDFSHLSKDDTSRVDFIKADLSRVNFHRANLSGRFFVDAGFSGADLSEADLSLANLRGAYLRGANLSKADLRHADLTQANLSEANLTEANLVGANLTGANVWSANLSHSDLTEANLRGATLFETVLSRANLSRTTLWGTNMRGVTLREANLTGANLTHAILVQANLTKTILKNCSIYGVAVWDVQLEGAQQDNLIVTPPNEPTITVDDLEVAQFIYLLLNHQKLRNALNAVTQRGVLLLGRFGGGGLEVLQAVAAKLREEQYLPIIFDFERPHERDYTETVKTLAGLARFIIADLSGPSVPQELYATVPHYKIPFAFICQADTKPFAMSVDLFGYPWVLQPALLFSTIEDLLAKLPVKVIEPTEEMVEKIRRAKEKTLDELFSRE